jgi:flap endonuclease-1
LGVDLGGILPKRRVELNEFSNWKLAVDAYNTLYQFLAIIRGMSGEPLRDSRGRVTSHLSGLFYRNINLIELGIKLVYVFDGKPPELKRTELERRRQQRDEAARKYTKAIETGDLVSARKFAEASTTLQTDMVSESKKLLEAMGIPWLVGPSEGEAQASVMASEGTVDAVASQDHDSLLFGAPKLARNVTISGKRRLPSKDIMINVQPELIELPQVLKNLDLTRESLIDVSILIGTDFNPDGFPGVGPARALKFVRRYGNLEKVKELRNELAQIDFKSIRDFFLNPPAVSHVVVEWKQPDSEKIKAFLVDEHSFSPERVDSALKRIEKVENVRNERLEKWFG